MFGENRQHLAALSSPKWERTQTDGNNGTTVIRFEFHQEFEGDGLTAEIGWFVQTTRSMGSIQPETLRLDESVLSSSSNNWTMTILNEDKSKYTVALSSCSYETLPLWRRDIELPGGDNLVFDVRFSESVFGTGRAALTRASWKHDGADIVSDDYFGLVYAADHHNWFEQFLFLLEEPVGEIYAVMVEEGFPRDTAQATVHWLGASFEILESTLPETYTITETSPESL